MFPSWLTRLVLALTLGLLPLQGLAETVHVLLCQVQGHVGAAHASFEGHSSHDGNTPGHGGIGHEHEGHGNAHAVAHDGPGADQADISDPAPPEGHAGHFCCHVVVAVLPTAAITVAQPRFPALQPAREGFHGSAFLESPQRPPLI